MSKPHKNPSYSLRIPQELKDYFASKAKQDGRSLNSYFIERLKEIKKQQECNA